MDSCRLDVRIAGLPEIKGASVKDLLDRHPFKSGPVGNGVPVSIDLVGKPP